jgi:hypothetical protein
MTLTILGTGLKKVNAEEDLLDIRKSDTAIKPFVFPKSMVVIRSCYLDAGGCVFLLPTVGVFGFDQEIGPKIGLISEILENKKGIKKYLVRLDPARIAPATQGKDFKGNLSRKFLKHLNKQYDVDFVFVTRRTFFHPLRSIRTQGVIYLKKQDKLLAIPFNDQTFKLNAPDLKKKVEEASQAGLQQLAKDARKVIHSYKFEKRRSNY